MNLVSSKPLRVIASVALGVACLLPVKLASAGQIVEVAPTTQPKPGAGGHAEISKSIVVTSNGAVKTATGVAATAPATAPAIASIPDNIKITAEARKEIELMRDAYRQLASFDVSGTITGHYDVAGDKRDPSTQFAASFQAPNKFRYHRKDGILLGATGDKAYAFLEEKAVYVQKDQAKDKPTLKDMPQPIGEMVQTESLPLALALSGDAAAQLLSNVTEVKKVDDATVGDKPYTALTMVGDAGEFKVLLDPATHLLRQVTVDQKHYLESNGQPDVKAAQVVWDYAITTPNIAVKPDQFAWAPPADARDATGANNNQAMADDDNAATKLEGKAAPDFKLPGIDGKDVAMTDLKGSVVVLDFWATWCGPCVASLPHLEKIYQDNKAAGVKIYAVNVDQDKAKVAPFIAEHKLTVPVLLDSEQTGVGEKYGANAIPETVVIGKDGKVKKVFVGFDPEGLTNAIKAAMKEGN